MARLSPVRAPRSPLRIPRCSRVRAKTASSHLCCLSGLLSALASAWAPGQGQAELRTEVSCTTGTECHPKTAVSNQMINTACSLPDLRHQV